MRQLKFRIWDGKCFRGNLKKYFLNLHDGEISEVAYSDLYDEYYDASERGSKLTIQQFTGLLDKNGKEIYEGDILIRYSEITEANYKSKVVFSTTSAAFVLDTSGRHLIDDKYGDYLWLHKDHSYEVIGNIFENSELLK